MSWAWSHSWVSRMDLPAEGHKTVPRRRVVRRGRPRRPAGARADPPSSGLATSVPPMRYAWPSWAHEVVDVDGAKFARLARGDLASHEPGLLGLQCEHVRTGRLLFATSYGDAADFGDIHLLSVGTSRRRWGRPKPPRDGSADTRAAVAAAAPRGGQVGGVGGHRPADCPARARTSRGSSSRVRHAVRFGRCGPRRRGAASAPSPTEFREPSISRW
ncbi:hypothetical protein [Kutzneria sp. NPDC052558]|uniref:hypothetical protein n=1 Tax=Kutzneria sp. NPDC052558 TaxID=3364121 RepID=UPI0037C849CB